MTNSYYNASGNPATGSEGLSSLMRAEFALIQTAFDSLPVVSGNGNKAVVVNAGGTGLAVTTGTLALAGNFATTGAFNTTLVQGASVSLTLPVLSGTLATLAGVETLSNKTFVAPALGTPASGVATNLTGTATGLTVGNATQAVSATSATSATTATTATNVSGGSASVTTLAASSTVSGAGFTARFSAPGPIGDVTPSTAAFTTLAASSTVSGAGFDAYLASGKPASFSTLAASGAVSGAGFVALHASPGPIGSTAASTGAFTTISASGQITSTQATGSAPFVVASTTNVANLNASTLSGATFASPGAIGGGSASTGAFTSVTASTAGTSGNQVVNFSQFNPGLAATGHILLPGGLILNWGVATTDGSGNATVTYNQALTTTAYMAVASSQAGATGIAVAVGSLTTFTVASFSTTTGVAAAAVSFYWIAVGK